MLPPRDKITHLVASLLPTIEDDYRVEGAEETDEPSMALTVGADADGDWGYQTGNNSFTGGAYGYPHWAVTILTRDSDPVEVAEEVLDQLSDLMES